MSGGISGIEEGLRGPEAPRGGLQGSSAGPGSPFKMPTSELVKVERVLKHINVLIDEMPAENPLDEKNKLAVQQISYELKTINTDICPSLAKKLITAAEEKLANFPGAPADAKDTLTHIYNSLNSLKMLS